MDIKKLIKSLLFIFVVVSLGVLVYKEFSPRTESNTTLVAATPVDKLPASEESLPVSESQPSKVPATAKMQKEKASSPQSEVKAQNSRVIAYYFHGTFRCTTCQTIEKYSKKAIEHYFANELKRGTLEFMPLNMEVEQNRRFIQDYQLVTRSLVLSLETDGKEMKWKNLPDVWKLVRDKEKFFQYVKDEVDKFLKET